MVGVVLSDDLKWQKNTDYICQRARQKLWTLRRMKKHNLDLFKIFDVYTKEVRSLLELGVPVWHSGLTKQQSAQIERIQKAALHIILEESYTTYDVACTIFGAEPLEYRREQLCINFAKKDVKRDATLFTKNTATVNTRTEKPRVREITCRTKRYQKSSLPYLSKLLNKQH